MRRSAAFLIAAAVPTGVAAAIIAPGTALPIVLMLAGFGVLSLGIAHRVVMRRDRIGSLQRQFALTLAVAGVPLVVIVVGFGLLMFVSDHDATLILLPIAFAAVVAVRAAELGARGVLGDVEAVRTGLTAVGRGEREIEIATVAHDEIEALAGAANAMVRRLDASEGAQRRLIAGVSHDLRTPLTSLRLLAEAVDDEVVDPTTRRNYLAMMRTHISALGALIDDLFELSRLQAGDIAWSVERVRLDELVTETVEAMGVGAWAEGIRVTAEVPSELSAERANPEKVQRVLFNLIQNAIRHTPADGSVTVRAEPTDDGVEIEVADTGTGMASEVREHAFEPAFRGGPDASRTEEGSGLGLAISRAIVEAHGGRIWLPESALGTRVRFSLPHGSGEDLPA